MTPLLQDISKPRTDIAARLRGNYVLLRADTLLLLLPQSEVDEAVYIDHAPQATDTPGLFSLGEGEQMKWVVALSDQMRALPEIPKDRFLLASMITEQGDLSLCWTEVRVLLGANLLRQPLPAIMRSPNQPIDGYVALDDGSIALCTSAERVIAWALGTDK